MRQILLFGLSIENGMAHVESKCWNMLDYAVLIAQKRTLHAVLL